MAKRSATECAGIFDICRRLQIITEPYHLKGREFLTRIVAMLSHSGVIEWVMTGFFVVLRIKF